MTAIFSVLWRSFRDNRRGNVLMIFAFSLIPLVFAVGMGIDYSRAARLRTKLNALADAAALAAVTQPMMEESDDTKVSNVATTMFQAQANLLGGMDGVPTLTVNLTHPDGAASRLAEVSYTAKSLNTFGGILNLRSILVGGNSAASASAPPNIDFYLALDTSPSMAMPTTQTDIDKMHDTFTCAFACHSNKIENYANNPTMPKGLILDNTAFAIKKPNNDSSTANGYVHTPGGYPTQKIDSKGTYIYVNSTVENTIDPNLKDGKGNTLRVDCRASSSNHKNICVYNADGTFVDSYWWALNQGIPLRVTAERAAVGDLMALAQSYATMNKRTYQAALYTFDHFENISKSLVAKLTSNLPSVTVAANTKVDLVQVNDAQANGCPPTGCGNANNYLFTSFYGILTKMLNGPDGLPTKSGKGTNAPGDTPQAFLFLVTDGMSDEFLQPSGKGRTRTSMQQAQLDQCTTIKNRGVKIAVLYTEYTTASIADDYTTDNDQWTRANNAITKSPTIAQQLTACASSPDLMYTVHANESISSALQSLFTKATQSARLVK